MIEVLAALGLFFLIFKIAEMYDAHKEELNKPYIPPKPDKNDWVEWMWSALESSRNEKLNNKNITLFCGNCRKYFSEKIINILGKNETNTSYGCPICYGTVSMDDSFMLEVLDELQKLLKR